MVPSLAKTSMPDLKVSAASQSDVLHPAPRGRGQPSATTRGRAAADAARDAATAAGQRTVWHDRAGAARHTGHAQHPAGSRGGAAGAGCRARRQ